MSYIINLTSGNVLTTILDGTINTSTGLTLIGRNYVSYGDAQNENFVKLLENFADTIPPTQSSGPNTLTGTLWFDTSNNLLKVYNNGGSWVPVSQQIVANSAPIASNTGDQWYDSVNQQLSVWNGSAWHLVGPTYTAGQGFTGTAAGTIVDTYARSHVVANTYTGGNLVSITSYDNTFTPNVSISGFANIQPGINLTSSATINGTSNNSLLLNNLPSSVFARVDQADTFTKDVSVKGNLVVGTWANVNYLNGSMVLENNHYQGNIDLVVFSTFGNTNVLHVDGPSAQISIARDPIQPNHISTKNYVDSGLANLQVSITNVQNELNGNLTLLFNDYIANISSVVTSTNGNLNSVQSSTNSNVNGLTSNVNSGFTALNANTASLQQQINNIDHYLTFVANIDGQEFTGAPTLDQTPPSNDNSLKIATTQYIDRLGASLTADYNTKINSEHSAMLAAVAPKAPTASPSFSGTPLAPNPGGSGSSQIATVNYVTGITNTLGTMASQNSNGVNITGGSVTGLSVLTVSGSITATGDVTAFASSDRQFKENIEPIPDALATARAIGGKLFDWTDSYIASRGGEDGYLVRKADFGVIAQDVQAVFPRGVRTRPDGSLAVDYEKLCALAFAAIDELGAQLDALKSNK